MNVRAILTFITYSSHHIEQLALNRNHFCPDMPIWTEPILFSAVLTHYKLVVIKSMDTIHASI